MDVVAVTTVSGLVAVCAAAATVGGAFVGILFRAAASAWREERDAAVDKADRLAEKVENQALLIGQLQQKVEELEKRTDYEVYAARSTKEHQKIIDALADVARNTHANSTAVEFLIRQVFPTVVTPQTAAGDGDAA